MHWDGSPVKPYHTMRQSSPYNEVANIIPLVCADCSSFTLLS